MKICESWEEVRVCGCGCRIRIALSGTSRINSKGVRERYSSRVSAEKLVTIA